MLPNLALSSFGPSAISCPALIAGINGCSIGLSNEIAINSRKLLRRINTTPWAHSYNTPTDARLIQTPGHIIVDHILHNIIPTPFKSARYPRITLDIRWLRGLSVLAAWISIGYEERGTLIQIYNIVGHTNKGPVSNKNTTTSTPMSSYSLDPHLFSIHQYTARKPYFERMAPPFEWLRKGMLSRDQGLWSSEESRDCWEVDESVLFE